MQSSHSIIIAVLTVVLTFALYITGDKYLAETSAYGNEIQSCESRQPFCEYAFLDKKAELIKKYGTTYEQSAHDYKRKKFFVVLPFMLLVIAAFVSFTIDEKERRFVALAFCPFLIYFMSKFIYKSEFCMGPFYLLFVVLATTFFVRVKRKLILKNP